MFRFREAFGSPMSQNRPPSSSAASRRSLVSSTWRGGRVETASASPNFLYGWLVMLVYIYMYVLSTIYE